MNRYAAQMPLRPPSIPASPSLVVGGRHVLALVLLLLLAQAGSIAAQTGTEAPIAVEIETTDEAIETRLSAIFSEIEEWRPITVTVEHGVVTLRGEVLEAVSAEQAAALAGRLDGVALVRDQTTIPRDLTRRLAPAVGRAQQMFSDLVEMTPLFVVAGVVVVLFAWLSGVVSRRRWITRRLSSNPFLADIARQAMRVAVVMLGVLLALELLDATALVGAVLGTAGVAGLALGFAFRDIVENYVASVLLSLRQPFAPNDHVVVDGREGKVVRLTSRATILLTLDGNHLRIPNSAVFKSSILNYTTNPLRRFDFAVGVGTEVDLATARRVGVESLQALESVLDEPPPSATVEALGDSSVVVRYFGWVDQNHYDFGKVRSAALVNVKTALDDAGIEMPEPIFRVRTSKIEAADVRAEESMPEPPIDEIVDVSTDTVIEAQVDKERRSGAEDLLSESAPQE